MRRLKFILFFSMLLACIYCNAQSAHKSTSQKKKAGRIVKAHRGTIVMNVHEKVNRTAQLPFAAFPKIGSIVTSLPTGAIKVNKDSVSYFYKNGFFYLQNSKGFQMVFPLPGCKIPGLPIGYRRVPVEKKPYFYFYGVFYAQAGNSDSYEVITAPEGAIVDAIPDGYKIEKVENVEYYLLGDVYFAEIDDSKMENKTGYEVVTIIQAYEIF